MGEEDPGNPRIVDQSSEAIHSCCGGRPCLRFGQVVRGRRKHKLSIDSDSNVEREEFSSSALSATVRHGPKKLYSVFCARMMIMVMFTVLIFVITLLTWHFTTVYTTRSIQNLAFSLRTEILQRPIARMWNILNVTKDTTSTQVSLSEDVIGRYSTPLSFDDQNQVLSMMKNVTRAVFTSKSSVNAISLVYIGGQYQAFIRNRQTNGAFYVYTARRSNSTSSVSGDTVAPSPDANEILLPINNSDWIWYRQTVDSRTGYATGPAQVTHPLNLTQNYDSSNSLGEGVKNWHVTAHGSDNVPFLACVSAVRHPQTGELLAVTAITQTLTDVSQLMRELVDLHSGVLYLTNAGGLLLASSSSSPLLKNTSTGLSLVMSAESSDPIIKASAQWLRDQYGTAIDNLRDVHKEDVMLNGQRYYLDTFVLNLTRLPLVGIIATPRDYVMGAVDRRGHATLVILISISACILAVGCVLTFVLTKGVSNEMKLRAQLIDQLKARRRAEASSNCKSQFLANMSHELRTPMAAVIGLLDILLCDDLMSPEQVAMVSQIRHCSTALLRLLNNILDLSKVESGKMFLEEEEFDLRRELEGLVDMFSVQCANQDIEIVLDLADDVPRALRGDSARTLQIFANLISNSIKFTSSGHVLLRGWCESASTGEKSGALFAKDTSNPWLPRKERGSIDLSTAGQEQNLYLWFEVDDTGCGIDPSKWETVFDSFVQADASTTRTYGGTGLGLCIVRSLVNKMGGEIKIVQKEGKGVLMRLFLVLKQSEDSSFPRKTSRDCWIPTFLSENLQNSRILLAMQRRTGRTTMGRWLRKNGLSVCEASSLEESVIEMENMVNICASNTTLMGLSILDIGLIETKSDLQMVEAFSKKGINCAWLLNHDTSSVLKGDLRRMGFSNMANKPVYKSKLVQILKVMSGSGTKDYGDGETALRIADVLSPVAERMLEHSASAREHRPPSMARKRRRSDVNGCQPLNYLNFRNDILESVKNDSTMVIVDGNCCGSNVDAHGKWDSILGRGSTSKGIRRYELRNGGNGTDVSHLPLAPVAVSVPDETVVNMDSCAGADPFFPCPLDAGKEEQIASDKVPMAGGIILGGRKEPPGQSNAVENGERNADEELTGGEYEGFADGRSGRNVIYGLSQVKPESFTEAGQGRSQQLRARQYTVTESQGDKRSHSLAPAHQMVHELSLARPAMKIQATNLDLQGIRILLAEDTPVLQKVASIMLKKMGAVVNVVEDGLEALNSLTTVQEADDMQSNNGANVPESRYSRRKLKYLDRESRPFDLVLMDCQMPRMDGYDATRAIRQAEEGTDSHIPIVALTAHAMSSDEAKCLQVGMDAYLTKPIDYKLMVANIRRLTSKIWGEESLNQM